MKTITSMVWLTLIALLFSGAALATTDREKLIERGKHAYLTYCSNCHGQDATGNGPIAQLLTVPTSDLTLLKREGMEEFPFGEVKSAIDGRKDVKPHGLKAMPVWGDAFGGKRAILINELIHYLETLQKNP
jgi:mono/diheme cytochrome c family protein